MFMVGHQSESLQSFTATVQRLCRKIPSFPGRIRKSTVFPLSELLIQESLSAYSYFRMNLLIHWSTKTWLNVSGHYTFAYVVRPIVGKTNAKDEAWWIIKFIRLFCHCNWVKNILQYVVYNINTLSLLYFQPLSIYPLGYKVLTYRRNTYINLLLIPTNQST